MTTRLTIDDLFDRRITLPDVEARERLHRLVGLDDHKTRLAKMLGLLINPSGLKAWVSKHHPGASGVLDTVLRRPPLVVLAGDVGSGKSELAETSAQARRSWLVGRMSAFSHEPLYSWARTCR